MRLIKVVSTAAGFLLAIICLAFVISYFSVIKAQNAQLLLQPQKRAELYIQTGHSDTIRTVAFSTDGKTLASGSNDKTVKLWNIETGQELRTLSANRYEYEQGASLKVSSQVTSVAFSPDGITLASGYSTTIKLWNVETGQEVRLLSGHTSGIDSVAFSPDGKTLASGSDDDTIKLWNVETGKELRTLSGHTSGIASVAFSRDGKTLASGSDDKTIKLWNVETGKELRTLSGHTKSVESVAFSSNGKTLASGSRDKTVKLWNVETRQKPRTLPGHPGSVESVTFSPDGKTLASGSEGEASDDEMIKLWEVETAQELHSLTGYFTSGVTSVAFSPDGKTLASGSGRRVMLWNIETGQELRVLSGHAKSVQVAFSPDGKTLALGSEDKTVRLWSLEMGRELRTLSGHTSEISRVAFSTDGKILVSEDSNMAKKFWNVETGKLIKYYDYIDTDTEDEVRREVSSLVSNYDQKITKDGRIQVKFGNNSQLDLFEVKTGRQLASLIMFDKSDWAVVTPDGLFDGSPAAWKLISWRLSERLYDLAPVEAFYNEFYRPGLLQDIFAGRTIERPKRDISTIDIRQPKVKLTLSGTTQDATGITARQVTINVEIKDAPADERRPRTSGARDVRLFRNGSLVKLWKGDVLKGRESIALTITVPVIAGNNALTAYAFNKENVKSTDATIIVTGTESLKRKGIAYVLSIGVNKYANPAYNLSYSVADANAFGTEISRWQQQLDRFERTEVVTLLDEQATKKNILGALQQIKKKAQPEDAMMIYFAGHGTAKGKRFYLIPHDLGYRGDRSKINESKRALRTMLQHSISDRELEEAVRGIDAGQMLFAIDACNSGQALEAEEKRRGPMNSAGLAQLAYEKGMYILTASQSYQFANESPLLGHGYLTYALVEKGLKSAAADANNDGAVDVREWFVYATEEVPRIYEEQMKKQTASKLAQFRARKTRAGLNGIDDVQRPRVFYRREVEPQPLIVARSRVTRSN